MFSNYSFWKNVGEFNFKVNQWRYVLLNNSTFTIDF
jgi:hypothetical protein